MVTMLDFSLYTRAHYGHIDNVDDLRVFQAQHHQYPKEQQWIRRMHVVFLASAMEGIDLLGEIERYMEPTHATTN